MGTWDERERLRSRALDALRWHWGEAYEISEALGVWRAVRRDNQISLVASDPQELRDLIVADYLTRPVTLRVHGTGRAGDPPAG